MFVENKTCYKKCKPNCIQEYYSYSINDIPRIMDPEKETVNFKSYNMPIFKYTIQGKLNLVTLVANLGGLVGLWFGMAFIDMTSVLNKIFNSLNRFLYNYIKIDVFIDF